jgi:hypothetical protein
MPGLTRAILILSEGTFQPLPNVMYQHKLE